MSSIPYVRNVQNADFEYLPTINEDLVSNRGLWRKIICILLCIAFVLSAWIVVILHGVNYSNRTWNDLIVSISVLVGGQYIVVGLIDAFIYWRRWRRTGEKVRTREKEENKEAWVCLRVTLTLLGLAPVSRYIESIVVIKRMIKLENRFKREAKEWNQDRTGQNSLISAPTTGGVSGRSLKPSNDPQHLRQVEASLGQVEVSRRRFRRTELDSANLALASGVAGAGTFIVAQGVLFFDRFRILFPMAASAQLGILLTSIIGLVWLTASLTHFYPSAMPQPQVDFERGVEQVSFGGLVLLFCAHLVHVNLRAYTFVLFIDQFGWIILGVFGIQLLSTLLSLIIARSLTPVDYITKNHMQDASIKSNLLSDIMHSLVGLYEFTNAHAKYTRIRYCIYYLLYYGANAGMIGAWYVHYPLPEAWYYLPSLLVVICVQFLGFILLQAYLIAYSRASRKRTLFGLCYAQLDPEPVMHEARVDQPEESLSRSWRTVNRSPSGVGTEMGTAYSASQSGGGDGRASNVLRPGRKPLTRRSTASVVRTNSYLSERSLAEGHNNRQSNTRLDDSYSLHTSGNRATSATRREGDRITARDKRRSQHRSSSRNRYNGDDFELISPSSSQLISSELDPRSPDRQDYQPPDDGWADERRVRDKPPKSPRGVYQPKPVGQQRRVNRPLYAD